MQPVLKIMSASLLGLASIASTNSIAATVNYTLYMTEGKESITIPLYSSSYIRTFWVEGFTDISGSPPHVSGIKLTASEGDTVNITVYNNTTKPHDFTLRNGLAAPAGPAAGTPTVTVIPAATIVSGASQAFSFTAPSAGSYFYYDPSTDTKTTIPNRAVGMYGAMIVYPAGTTAGSPGNLWTGGPGYTADFTWVLTDFDKRVNDAKWLGTVFSSTYKATYAFINGEFGGHSMKNAETSPVSNVGDTVAIRVVNGGMISHPLHFHGYHGELVSVNNVRQNRVLEKDVLDVPPMTTMDLIFHINQKGIYIVHDHTGMMVTQDGVYAEGMIAEFDVCKKEGGLIANDTYCPIPTIGAPGSGWIR